MNFFLKENKMKNTLAFVLVLLMTKFTFGYSGGTGEPNTPYQIADVNDLLQLANDANDYNKCFIMTADIDLDPCLPGNQIFTTAIIAPASRPSFTGSYNGDGHKIFNLTIITDSNDYLGLFGRIYGGEVNNLGLEDVNVNSGDYSSIFGGLVGENEYGYINNSYSVGNVIGGYWSTTFGGLVGLNLGTINNCYSRGKVECERASHWYFAGTGRGGLVGTNPGTILNSYSNCDVIGDINALDLGGLVGANPYGYIANCYSTGNISMHAGVTVLNDFGGLVGNNVDGTLINCFSIGDVNGGIGSWGLGGLVGKGIGGSIYECFSTGSVSGSSCLGGLIGFNGSYIDNCYSSGNVTGGVGSTKIGGLVGESGHIDYPGHIRNSYSTGTVIGTTYIGGLVGFNNNSDINSSYFLNTSGPDNGYGEPLTDSQMKQKANFVNWDFVNIWLMCADGLHYPFLRWQYPNVNCGDGNDINDINDVNECFPFWPPYESQYSQWVSVGKPVCWCRQYANPQWNFQCYGDTDNKAEGIMKYRVYTSDYTRMFASWRLKATQFINNSDPNVSICADFDQKSEGLFKYRVYTSDYNVLIANWRKKDTQLHPWCTIP